MMRSFLGQIKNYIKNFEVDDAPIPTEGGPFGPEQPKTVWHFHSFMTGVTKIHDFVCFSICLVPVKLFWEKKL